MKLLVALALAALAGCSQPAMVRVEADEAVEGATLVLNGRSAPLIKNVDGAYWGKWNGGDADGLIEVRFAVGATAVCRVGYLSSGMGVQEFRIDRRQCRQVAT